MYVVAGVSGNTGSVVARRLLEAGKKVRVIVRDTDKGADWQRQGAEVAVGTLQDAAFISKALEGAEGAYLLLPPNWASGDMRQYLFATAEALVEGVKGSGVKHLTFLSSVGAQHEKGTGPIDALGYAERKLRQLPGLAATFLRPAYFMENWGGMIVPMQQQGFLPAFFRPDLAIPMIATPDIGAFAAEAVLKGGSGFEVLQLAGPREYSHNDVAAIAGKRLGREIKVVPVSAEAAAGAIQQAGLPADVASEMAQLDAGIDSGAVAFEPKLPVRRGQLSLEQVLGKMLGK